LGARGPVLTVNAP